MGLEPTNPGRLHDLRAFRHSTYPGHLTRISGLSWVGAGFLVVACGMPGGHVFRTKSSHRPQIYIISSSPAGKGGGVLTARWGPGGRSIARGYPGMPARDTANTCAETAVYIPKQIR